MSLEAMYEAAAKAVSQMPVWSSRAIAEIAVDAALAEMEKVEMTWLYGDGWRKDMGVFGVDEPGTYAIVGPL